MGGKGVPGSSEGYGQEVHGLHDTGDSLGIFAKQQHPNREIMLDR